MGAAYQQGRSLNLFRVHHGSQALQRGQEHILLPVLKLLKLIGKFLLKEGGIGRKDSLGFIPSGIY